MHALIDLKQIINFYMAMMTALLKETLFLYIFFKQMHRA